MILDCFKTKTFCLAAVYVKVIFLHFLSQYQEKKMVKKVYQEVSKVYILVDIINNTKESLSRSFKSLYSG
jgi:hypothetical protein